VSTDLNGDKDFVWTYVCRAMLSMLMALVGAGDVGRWKNNRGWVEKVRLKLN
jgi:hypothetical protein